MKYYYIYKITHTNGKYYLGRHSTRNLDDGYMGSGKWPRSIRDKSTLRKEILEFVNNVDDLKELEGQYLKEHYGKPGCMNLTPDPVGISRENNPMLRPESVKKISGDNHWLRRNPERTQEISQRSRELIDTGEHNFLGEQNPNSDGRNGKLAMTRGKNVFQTINPSTWRSEQGVHHWQNGNAPNTDGKLNKKLVAEGRHNFQGPKHNQKMITEGRHNFLGSDSNLRMLAEGRHPSQKKKTCEHCGKVTSSGMYVRWHGEKCRTRA
jgi:hypothetical protein